MITGTLRTIQDVKEYLKAYSVIAKNNKHKHIESNVAECIVLLLEHCEEMEQHVPDIILIQAGVKEP